MMVSGIFHLIPLYWGSQIPKWKAFLPNQVQFSLQFRVFEVIFDVHGQNFHNFFFTRFIVLKTTLLLYSKRSSWNYGFKAKIHLKNEPPWAEIFSKMCFNMACQTKPRINKYQDGRFEYNKRYKQSKKNYENFVHKKKSPQKP